MNMQYEIWDPSEWIIQYKTVSVLNPRELLYSVIIGVKDNFEYPYITKLISKDIYDLILNNEVELELNLDSKELISVYSSGKKLNLRNITY